MPDLVDHTICNKKYVSFKKKLDKEANKKILNPESFVGVMEAVTQQIREKMNDISNKFDGNLTEESIANAVPPELLILINYLVNGHNDTLEKGFPLPVKTIAQIIMFNHKKD